MFSNLRSKPGSIQLLVFLMLWFCCTALFGLLQPLILNTFGNGATDLKTAKEFAENLSPTGMLLIMVATQLISFLLPAILFVMLLKVRPARYFNLKPTSSNKIFLVSILALGTVLLLMSSGSLIKMFDFGIAADALQKERELSESALFKMNGIGALLTNIMVAAFLPAICEELFFRGVVQRFINTLTQKPWLSIIITAIIFSFFHGSVYNFLPIVIAGVVLGAVYHFTGNLKYSMLLHFINNAAQLVVVYLTQKQSAASPKPAIDDVLPILLMLVLGGAIVIFIFKKLKTISVPLPNYFSVVLPQENLTSKNIS